MARPSRLLVVGLLALAPDIALAQSAGEARTYPERTVRWDNAFRESGIRLD